MGTDQRRKGNTMETTLTGRATNNSSTNPVLVVDSYARGISIGKIDPAGKGLELQVDEGRRESSILLRSRYVMKSGEPLLDLERHLGYPLGGS
jgi:hypothetical protein